MHKPQIHEVVLAPVLLWHHMVYVGFLAILQYLAERPLESYRGAVLLLRQV
jgi:hypothetical protein